MSAELRMLQSAMAGRYLIERELGRGGMGIVFLARDLALERPVAIKLLPPHLAGLPELRSRFLQEARTAARLAHPNIVPIHAVEERGELRLLHHGLHPRRDPRRAGADRRADESGRGGADGAGGRLGPGLRPPAGGGAS